MQIKKILIILLTSFITYFGILIYTKLFFTGANFNMLIALAYFVIFYFYYKYNLKVDKRTSIYVTILSMLISFMLSVGSIVSTYIYEEPIDIFYLKNIVYIIISFCGLFILLKKLFCIMFIKLKNIKIIDEHPKMKNKYFFLMLILILFAYSFYYIRYYPAIMTPDSYYVLHYANNFILSDFHTFGHTWFVGIFFHLGKVLFNNMNMAVGFAIIIQMICMASIFAGVIRFLYNRGLNKYVCMVILLFYMFNPLHAFYSMTLWRDILFGGAFAVLLVTIYEFVSRKKISIIHTLLFIMAVLILLFFRNNGIYVYLFMIPFLIIILKDKRIFISILTFSLLIFYLIIKGPVFDYFNITKTTSVEAYSIPLQQMARVIAMDKDIDNESKEYLKELFDYEKVPETYKNIISDPIKNLTNKEVLDETKNEFFKTYLTQESHISNLIIGGRETDNGRNQSKRQRVFG